jgi:hypothetical protein
MRFASVCLRVSGPQPYDLGCTNIPAARNGVASCACMTDCFCNTGVDKCVAQNDGSLLCNNGTISRRAFKTHIEYVSPAVARSSIEREANLRAQSRAWRDMDDAPEVTTHVAPVDSCCQHPTNTRRRNAAKTCGRLARRLRKL